MKKNKTHKILSHFKKVDPILFSIASKVEFEILEPRKSNDYLISLCREIIGQQLNGKVARIIFKRFIELFPNKKVDAKYILRFSDQKLRDVGMAWSKVNSIKDLAKKVSEGSLNLEKLAELDDSELMDELTKVKGIGPWTAEMFLMFTLGREDVFSDKDLGLRKAMMKNYGKELTREQTAEWSPYRTYASLILWKSLDL